MDGRTTSYRALVKWRSEIGEPVSGIEQSGRMSLRGSKPPIKGGSALEEEKGGGGEGEEEEIE